MIASVMEVSKKDLDTLQWLNCLTRKPDRMCREEREDYFDRREDFIGIAPKLIEKIEKTNIPLEYFGETYESMSESEEKKNVSKEVYLFSDAAGLLHLGKKINGYKRNFIDTFSGKRVSALPFNKAVQYKKSFGEDEFTVSPFAYFEDLYYIVGLKRVLCIDKDGRVASESYFDKIFE